MNLPSKINIETNTYCNRTCSYCPPKGDSLFLDEKYVKKIIDELSGQKLRKLSFHGYNEPLTDLRIRSFISYARERLPKTIISLPTNGDFLTVIGTQELIYLGVDQLKITLHDPSTEEFVGKIYELGEIFQEITIVDLREEHKRILLSNRGGSVKLEGPAKRITKCPHTKTMMIRATGNVVSCFQDFYQNEIFGNIKNQKVLDIWNSKKFKEFRNNAKKGKSPSTLCEMCEMEI